MHTHSFFKHYSSVTWWWKEVVSLVGCSSGRTYFILSKRFGSVVGSMLRRSIRSSQGVSSCAAVVSVVFGLSIVRWLTLFWFEIINRAQYSAVKWRDRKRKQIWSAWFSLHWFSLQRQLQVRSMKRHWQRVRAKYLKTLVILIKLWS